MKCQLSRSGLSNGKDACALCSSDKVARNRPAASAIAPPDWSASPPAQTARPIIPRATNAKLGFIPRIGARSLGWIS
jgi:hypothetical protein